MHRLSLEHSYQSDEDVTSSSDGHHRDEGFFEDHVDDDVMSDQAEESKLPQYKLAPDVKDSFEEMLNGILPQKIYKSVNESCMAVIPYVSPTDLLLPRSLGMKKTEDKHCVEIDVESPARDKLKCEDSEEIMNIDSVC